MLTWRHQSIWSCHRRDFGRKAASCRRQTARLKWSQCASGFRALSSFKAETLSGRLLVEPRQDISARSIQIKLIRREVVPGGRPHERRGVLVEGQQQYQSVQLRGGQPLSLDFSFAIPPKWSPTYRSGKRGSHLARHGYDRPRLEARHTCRAEHRCLQRSRSRAVNIASRHGAAIKLRADGNMRRMCPPLARRARSRRALRARRHRRRSSAATAAARSPRARSSVATAGLRLLQPEVFKA